jgi:diguanylate cyclase (GGDEF)-like protein
MRILIADDDPVWRRMIEAMLVQFGAEVEAVSDGKQAWQALQAQDRPSLAILDWLMPGMDGLEICRKMRQTSDSPYVYILLLTVKDEKADVVAGFEAGADDYICKPFDPDELRGRLRAAQRVIDLQAALLKVEGELRVRATRDSLTGLWNRGAILEILEKELARCERESKPVGVLVADVDLFKPVNDTYGHAAGDAVLREVAERIQSTLRSYDSVGRYGGEEFLAVLPACDDFEAAGSAERIRCCIAAEPFVVGAARIALTMSVGVVSSRQARGSGADRLIHAADTALYRAKSGGRNLVEAATLRDLDDALTREAEAG